MRTKSIRYAALLLLTFAFGVTICATAPTEAASQHYLRQPAAAAPSQPTGLTAFHRSGQTFLTWNEVTQISGEGYHVYRHTAPIHAGNIGQATCLTATWGPLPEGSSIFYTDRDRGPGGSTYPGLRNYVITDLGPQLADTTGLFVWTSKQSGNFYYAVTTVQGNVENRTDFNAANALASAVAETVADPQPVLVWQSPNGCGRVYTQFMDFETFNPTFERPYQHPDGGLQYAYNYWVGVPTPDMCGGALPEQLALYLHIEGYGSRYEVSDQSPWWCAVEIWADDPRPSWYYGFSSSYDYRTGGTPDHGPIVNYTEERLLRSIYDTMRNPDYHIDPRRIYVYGHSMGGSGALALAMRYPNVFAASYSSEPMTNYCTSGQGGGTDWTEDTVPKWGSIAANLPIENRGRYAAHLAAYNGTGVWDWQNHQAQLVSRRRDEMAHISLAHGTLDTVVEWSTQGRPAYAPFYQGRRAFSGATVEADHTWIGFSGMGPNVAERDYAPFYGFNVLRDESLPGLTNASGSSPLPPPGAKAAYNMNLEWSASWDNWDGAPVDTASQWRISLRTTDGSSQTMDVTPRRLQRFRTAPGASYAWENRRVSDNSLVASGTVTADADGLVTVLQFAVSPAGNRLILEPSGAIAPTSTVSPPATPTRTRTPTRTATGTARLTNTLSGTRTSRIHLPMILKNWPTVAMPTATHTRTVAAATATPTRTRTPARTPTATLPPSAIRPLPDTTTGIHVFNDQLAGWMSEAQFQFAATHYDGTQKMTRSDADHLRSYNPDFVILNYRLGLGLGYRAVESGCNPNGDWLLIIEGDNWVKEWPGDSNVSENWFYHWPAGSTTRVLNCDWGWYLMDPDNASWRAYWAGEVLRQLRSNHADGVFVDSFSVPNYLGADRYLPALPELDAAFESTWARRLRDFIAFAQSGDLAPYHFIPNAGQWVTSRDPTDYSGADGVMIEGFAGWGMGNYFDLSDWQLQVDRILGLMRQNKAILAQQYVDPADVDDRMFILGCYLLIKGRYTYLNLEVDLDPEWFPEYGIPIGSPTGGIPANAAALWNAAWGVYTRTYSNGLVLVNPTTTTRTVHLDRTYYQAMPHGGGFVPADGQIPPSWTVSYAPVTQVTLAPNRAAVLLNTAP